MKYSTDITGSASLAGKRKKMALTRSESDGSPESAVADGPVAEEVDQSPGRARLHAGQLIGEFTAEAAQQLRRVD